MITAVFYEKGRQYVGFCVSGHAEHEIACACVSSAVQLTANGVTELAHIPASVEAKGDTVRLELSENRTLKPKYSLLRCISIACALLRIFLDGSKYSSVPDKGRGVNGSKSRFHYNFLEV